MECKWPSELLSCPTNILPECLVIYNVTNLNKKRKTVIGGLTNFQKTQHSDPFFSFHGNVFDRFQSLCFTQFGDGLKVLQAGAQKRIVKLFCESEHPNKRQGKWAYNNWQQQQV